MATFASILIFVVGDQGRRLTAWFFTCPLAFIQRLAKRSLRGKRRGVKQAGVTEPRLLEPHKFGDRLKASGYTSSSSSRNSLASTRPINRYDGLESSCCMDSNLPRFPSLHSETLSHQWQDATLVAENSKRLIHGRAYRTSALPTERLPFPLFPIHRAAES